MGRKNDEIRWFDEPEPHNYPAALSYLCLLYAEGEAKTIVEELREAQISSFKAKDIFRASELSLLVESNSHVERNHEKIEDGKSLSPILLVRTGGGGKVIVADGYHRLCSVYHYDEDALIPCKIATARA